MALDSGILYKQVLGCMDRARRFMERGDYVAARINLESGAEKLSRLDHRAEGARRIFEDAMGGHVADEPDPDVPECGLH